MDMLRITARWTGFSGGPGYSNFFFAGGGGFVSDAQQVSDRVVDAFGKLGMVLPTGVTVTTEAEAAIVDSDTGMLTGFQPVDQGSASGLVGDTSYSGPSGAVVNWRTEDVRFGRRIMGRTFIVPIRSDAYDSQGTLTSGVLEDLRDFADTLTSWDFDSEFGVWSRPRDGSGGVFATATSYNVPDKAAVLRSRRD